MSNAPTVSIAMATYNGERYIAEQLASFAAQTQPPLELVVGDDGSTDRTVAMIEDFARTAPFPVHLHCNPRNLGFADNFLTAASRCLGDWIAFSDQDDVWSPDKLATAAAAMEGSRNRGLVAIGHRLELVDSDLRRIGRSLPDDRGNIVVGPGSMPAYWCHGGCALLFDAALVRHIDWTRRPPNLYDWSRDGKPQQRQMAHDQWISLLANTVGSTRFLSRSLGLFRRHANATTGSQVVRLSDRLRSAAAIDVDDYRQGASHARAVADALGSLASNLGGEWARRMIMMAARYRHRADRLADRARLYESGSRSRRFGRILGLLDSSAYGLDPVAALGPKALLKDIAMLARGARSRG